MSIKYQHSEVMAKVKASKESIKENFSSNQYIELLDELFYRALEPILLHSNHSDHIIAACLHNSSLNSRRKISSIDKGHMLSLMALFLSVPRERKLKVLKQIRLERSILRFIIKSWLDRLSEYEKLYVHKSKVSSLKRDFIKRSIEFSESADLFCQIQTVRFWYSKASEYQNKIVEKYLRLIAVHSQSHYKNNNSRMELNDIIQNLSLYTSKAIDKFDPSCGTLTSYITNWMSHGKSVSSQHELGSAFILPSGKRKEVKNISISIDDDEVLQLEHDDNVENDIERMSTIERVRMIAKVMDPVGLARCELGIKEVFTESEVALQKLYAK